jgi:hypothetical protein
MSSPDFLRTLSSSSDCFELFSSVAYMTYSSTLKIDALCSTETSVRFYQTARRHVLDDSTLHILTTVSWFRPTRWIWPTEILASNSLLLTMKLQPLPLSVFSYFSSLDKEHKLNTRELQSNKRLHMKFLIKGQSVKIVMGGNKVISNVMFQVSLQNVN